jgi:hypothetical protein
MFYEVHSMYDVEMLKLHGFLNIYSKSFPMHKNYEVIEVSKESLRVNVSLLSFFSHFNCRQLRSYKSYEA